MTPQAIFDKAARGLILQGSKSRGDGQMWHHAFRDRNEKKCALGLLLPESVFSTLNDNIYTALNAIFECNFAFNKLALELMRIHNCCEVPDWPVLLAACAVQFNLDASAVPAALAELAERALATSNTTSLPGKAISRKVPPTLKKEPTNDHRKQPRTISRNADEQNLTLNVAS